MRNRGFYAHNRGRYFVQQGSGETIGPSFFFVAPTVNTGVINEIIEDGADGWYIGGTFTSITDSVATYTTGYTRLVRLRPDGTIDAGFSCPVGGTVSALALDSTGLYIGGIFSGVNSVGTSTRGRVARVRPFNDPAPGAVDAWRPDANSSVHALVLDSVNGKLYMGGSFQGVGGVGANFALTTRNRIARVTTGATASADNWRPDANNSVHALVLDSVNGKLYMGGSFQSVGGVVPPVDFTTDTRRYIARVTTGASATLDVWNPNIAVATIGSTFFVFSMVLDSANGTLYIGGEFTNVSGSTRNRLARVTTGVTSTLDAWNPNVSTAPSRVKTLALDSTSGYLYIGGVTFTTVSGSTRNRLARVTTGVTSTLDAWDPSVSAADAAEVSGILIYPALGRAIVVGNFNAIANQVDTIGNCIAGLVL